MTVPTLPPLTRLLAVTATLAAMVPLPAWAFNADDAEEITVQINVTPDRPGASPGGSGVIIARSGDRYLVLTAYHVVCDRIPNREPISCISDITYSVQTSSGDEYPITGIRPLQQTYADPDLAVVEFTSSRDYEVATFGDSDSAVLASQVFIAGYPTAFGTEGRERDFFLSPGPVVSRRDRAQQGYSLVYGASTKVGMSGGPVFDADGRLVGIHGLADVDGLGQTETGSGGSAAKSGFNAGIPIDTFISLSDRAGLGANSFNIDSRAPSEDPANIDNPQNAEDYRTSGAIELYNGNTSEALEDFSQALDRDPNGDGAAFAYLQQGNAYFGQGQYNLAVEEFTAAADVDDELAGMAYTNRAAARIQMQDYRGAIADLTAAIEEGYADARTYYNRGVAYTRLGDRASALADYELAARLDGNFALALNALGNAYAEDNDRQRALEQYDRAIAANPNFGDAYNNRATLYNQNAIDAYDSGAIDRAIAQMEAAAADLERALDLFSASGRSMQYQEARFNLQDVRRNLRILRQQRPAPPPEADPWTPPPTDNRPVNDGFEGF